MKTCPACGQPITSQRVPVEALASIPLSAVRRTIVRKLVDRYPLDVPADNLLFEIYGGSHEPENARCALSVQLASIRTAIQPYGWTIPPAAGGRGNFGMYRLKPYDPSQLTHPNPCSLQSKTENKSTAIDASQIGAGSTGQNIDRRASK